MARLSKAQAKDRGRFTFAQEEVELSELTKDDEEVKTVLVRAPSVKQRDELDKNTHDEDDWTLDDTAYMFSVIVIDPDVSVDEAKEFIGDWPGPALDKVIEKFMELIGKGDALRKAAGEFRSTE